MSGFGRHPKAGEAPPTESEAREMALRYLARRDYSCLELSRKLGQRGVVEELADSVVQRLSEAGLVSDQRFAEIFTRTRVNNAYGPMRIRAELRQKGVSDPLIAAAMQPFEDTWHQSARDWVVRRHRGVLDRKAQARLYRGGTQRGFSHDHIMRAIEWLRSAE